jgi:hypothetical protein
VLALLVILVLLVLLVMLIEALFWFVNVADVAGVGHVGDGGDDDNFILPGQIVVLFSCNVLDYSTVDAVDIGVGAVFLFVLIWMLLFTLVILVMLAM